MKNLVLILCLTFRCWANADLYYIDDTEFNRLNPVQQQGIGTPDNIIMAPNVYGFNGPSYDCTQEGFYNYYIPTTNNAYRIVYSNSVDMLLHSLTWVHCHGYRDDAVSYSSAKTIVKTDKLHMTCGSIVRFAQNLCDELNIEARTILWLTLEPWNTYNNGHSMIEVKQNGVWKVWDIDLRTTFTKNSIPLNAQGLKEAVAQNNFNFSKFSDSPILAYGDMYSGGYNYQNFFETSLLSSNTIRQFYKRSCQVLLIKRGNYFYFTSSLADKPRIQSYDVNFVYMPPDVFMQEFYP